MTFTWSKTTQLNWMLKGPSLTLLQCCLILKMPLLESYRGWQTILEQTNNTKSSIIAISYIFRLLNYLSSKVHGMINKVHAGRSVDRWNPHQASPTYIKSSCQNEQGKFNNNVLYHVQKRRRKDKCDASKNLYHVQYPWCSSIQLPTKKIW